MAGYGFGVEPFPMAAAALNTTKVIAYDAIVLDRELPYRDGLEVLGELRQSTALAHQSALYLSMDRSKPVLYDCEPGFFRNGEYVLA